MPPTFEDDTAAACLCPAGRAKLREYVRLIGMERLVTQEEIDQLWPGGPPREETRSAALEAAGIPPLCWEWTIESYRKRFGKDRGTRALLRQADDWLKATPGHRTDVVIFGPHGTGKTGLAIGMLIECIEHNERARLEDARRLFMGWRETFREDATMSEERYLAQWESVPTLILDEVQEGSDKSRPVLQLLIDRRQKMRRPSVLVLNVPEDCADTTSAQPYLAQQLGPALFDRLRERAQFWALLGASRRQALVLAFDGKSREEKHEAE
jgi:DNA replication protein DnaC